MARLVHHLGGFLFVGNSHTYQPKELGGIPGAFARLAGAYGQDVSLAATDIGPERLQHEIVEVSCFSILMQASDDTYQYISIHIMHITCMCICTWGVVYALKSAHVYILLFFLWA